jgi:hypothetical protein
MIKYMLFALTLSMCLSLTCSAQTVKKYRQVDSDTEKKIKHVIPQDDDSSDVGGDTNGGDTNGGDTNGGDTNGGDTNGGDTNGGDTTPEQTRSRVYPRERLSNVCRTMRGACAVGGVPGAPCTCSGTFVQMTLWGPRVVPFTDLGILQ